MNILVLGISPSPLTPIIERHGCRVTECAGPIDVDFLTTRTIEFVVSYRYRHIIKKAVIEHLKWKVINLHISLLPWNRGADPNLWSFLEDSPKGVTIHHLDEGIDTGDIIAQREVSFDEGRETLSTTYDKLNKEIIALFGEKWPIIMQGKALRYKQPPGGSFHRLEDKEKFLYLVREKGWNTPVALLVGKALESS